MLKSLIFIAISWMTFSTAHAQNARYQSCVNSLEYYFLASQAEAHTVCRQNSSPDFMQCMVHRAKNSNMHVLEAAPKCSSFKVEIPVETKKPNYVNLKSCPSKLQMRARMSDRRAKQICDWDSSPVMQNCLIDLVEQARCISENAIRYCGFANTEYRAKIPQFAKCVIDQSKKGYDVHTNVKRCDSLMYYGKFPESMPVPQTPAPQSYPPKTQPQYPQYPQNPQYPLPSPQMPEVVTPTQPVVIPDVVIVPPVVQPAPNTPGRTVPTPVDIKIEGSSNIEVNDQPIETGSTSNSESLPL